MDSSLAPHYRRLVRPAQQLPVAPKVRSTTWDAPLAGRGAEIGSSVVHTLLASRTRPRILKRSDGVMITPRGINTHDPSAPEAMMSLRHGIDEHKIVTCRLSRATYLFSVAATICLPLSFLTGLMGVNVGGIPGFEFRWRFWLFLAMYTGSVLAQVIYFR